MIQKRYVSIPWIIISNYFQRYLVSINNVFKNFLITCLNSGRIRFIIYKETARHGKFTWDETACASSTPLTYSTPNVLALNGQ